MKLGAVVCPIGVALSYLRTETAASAFVAPGVSNRVRSPNHQFIEFVHSTPWVRCTSTDSRLLAEKTGEEEKTRSTDQSKLEQILSDIHAQGLRYRVVVVGNGAILESTSVLGPHFSTSTSPKTGEELVTFASDDKSFEFHLKIRSVSKVNFSVVERSLAGGDTKIMHICRFTNDVGDPMCSLILADSSPGAVAWFDDMIERYGTEVQLSA